MKFFCDIMPYSSKPKVRRISEAVETTPGMTTNQILSLVNGRREYKIQATNNLVAEGYVRTEPGPRNARLHHSEKPYREPQP